MINHLSLESFKCVDALEIELKPLTILSGQNAAGKSTIIQSLALLKQSIIENEWSTKLKLNGKLIELGSMYDVINRKIGGSGFKIKIGGVDWFVKWETQSENRKQDQYATINIVDVSHKDETLNWKKDNEDKSDVLNNLLPIKWLSQNSSAFSTMNDAITSIYYISAERIGPRHYYFSDVDDNYKSVGNYGQNTPICLYRYSDKQGNPGLVLEGVPNNVRQMVTGWMKVLFSGFEYQVQEIEDTNLIKLQIRTRPNGEFFRPFNVGFGISHILPIISQCIIAESGDTILIENPESHLHPFAQSQIGMFIGQAISKGVQIIVETHSDHVINGIRRAVKDGKVESEMTRIYFIDQTNIDSATMQDCISSIDITREGKITKWPDGFIDQFESDVNYLFSNK